MSQPLVQGVFQVGVLVTDIDECLRLFCGALGMRVVFEARNQVQPARGLSGVDGQIMDVLMLHGEGGVDLELHRYVAPPAHEPQRDRLDALYAAGHRHAGRGG